MIENQQLIDIEPMELLSKVTALKAEGYRLVQIHCTNKNGLELNYSFDKDYQFVNLRFFAAKDVEVTSISGIFYPAFAYENEVKELFGVNYQHINIDYKGNFYKKAMKTPFINDVE